MELNQFKSFVIEKLLLSLVRRHSIRHVKIEDNTFSISTESHIVRGVEFESHSLQCLSISIERDHVNEGLMKLYYSEETKYFEMLKNNLSTFDADVLSPLNNVFDDWNHERLGVITFGINDPVSNLFRYKIASNQLNKLMIARSRSGFVYAFLDSDMKQFIENRDKGLMSNIILRRVDDLEYKSLTAEMPFNPALELFEDEIGKPVTKKPHNYNYATIGKRPEYWMKSPTRDVWIVILESNKKSCKTGYTDSEPDPYDIQWEVYNIRSTKVYYTKENRRYQILRGGDCVDITHLIRK